MARIMPRASQAESLNAMEYSMNTILIPRSLSSDDQNPFGIKRSLQTWYRKRNSASPSPTRSLRSASPVGIFTSPTRTRTDPEELRSSRARRYRRENGVSAAVDSIQVSGGMAADRSPTQSGTILSTGRRRRSSARQRRLDEPASFTKAELQTPLELPHFICRRIGCVSRPEPEPGWRIATRPRSPETCFMTSLPIYSGRHHSPLAMGQPLTIYFECDIRPVDSDDPVHLAVGFVAGKDRALRLPGFERGSIGVHARDGRLYLNNKLLEKGSRGAFEPGEQLGIGITFSRRVENEQTTPAPLLQAVAFVTREGRKVGTWDLGDQAASPLDLSGEGFGGSHDLYAAVGTCGEVNVDVHFEKRNWMYNPGNG